MRRLVTLLTVSVFVCLLVQALPGTSLAQSGKLAGTVTDGATGDPIPGATVVLEGTQQGSATDAGGNYFLIGIRPETYTVRFSFVGYATKLIENVLVTSDRTTSLDVTLESEVVEGAEIVVEAVRPVVDPNQTTSRSLVTSEEISRLPVRSLEDVVAKTANSFNGYLRGSRQYETKTVLEGIDISDAWFQTSRSGNGDYGGNTYHNTNKTDKTSPSSFSINPDGVSEVTVNTGATEAKYAAGTGGLVTVSLREERGPIHGSVMVRFGPQTNRPGPDSLEFYQEIEERGSNLPQDSNGDGIVTSEEKYLAIKATVAAAAAGGDQIAQRRLLKYTWEPGKYAASEDPEMDIRGSLGGSITENWHFSGDIRFFESHGWMPNQFDRMVTGQMKSTYELSEKTSLTAVGLIEDRGLWGSWNNRNYRDFFKFNLESVAQDDWGSYLGSLKLTQVMNDHSYLTVQAYRTYWRDRYGYPDDDGNHFVDPGEDGDFIDFFNYTDAGGYNAAGQWEATPNGRPDVVDNYVDVSGAHDKMFEQNISDSFCDSGLFLPNGLRYRLACPVVYSEDTKVTLNGVKVDYANQINANHFVQFGGDAKLRTIDYQEAYGVDGIGFTINREKEPWIPSDWDRSPKEFGLYVSDRMEYAGLVVNAGLRVDLIDRDAEEFVDYFYPYARDTVTIDGIELGRNFANRGESVSMDVFFNPSIGVSHPIGSNASMYFAYKRANQMVPYHRL
ncbi:MAG TPA: TonB-dependent receptor, partial [Rhodothermia bacterium]|nr:TonB-dependent receptor [Rhodothermia bacterium]